MEPVMFLAFAKPSIGKTRHLHLALLGWHCGSPLQWELKRCDATTLWARV